MKINNQIANVRFALIQDKTERASRPKFATAVIMGGYIYATDATIMVKFSVNNYMEKTYYSNGEPELNHSLDGLLLSFDVLTQISKAKNVEFIDGELFLDNIGVETGKHNNITYTGWQETIDGETIEPKLLPYDTVMPTQFEGSFQNVGIDYEALNRLGKCFRMTGKKPNTRLHLEFHKNFESSTDKCPTRAIKVTNIINRENYDEFAIIMPVMTHNA